MLNNAPDRPPGTPNEWGVLVIISFFFALFLVVDLAREFSIQKLSVPFFLVSWVVLLVVHEFGHALVARALGWRVEKVSIGTGRVRAEYRLLGLPVEFRTLPLSGYVVPRPLDLRLPRVKHFLIYAAGPGVELLSVALWVVILGTDRLLAASAAPAILAIQSYCVAALFGSIFNLIPLSHTSGNGIAWSDGLGMIHCWGIPDEEYRRMRDEK
ncbi:MAG: M50 family metallopeptidase [Verrucomicrobiae bacterium]|nr:M50 family metallopeptidase [Verrucomicrobiae bacterium]